MPRPNKREYGEAFLYAEDLTEDGVWKARKFTVIQAIEPHTITADNRQVIDKWVIKLSNGKLLALGKTNTRIVNLLFGDVEKSVDKELILCPREIECFGESEVPAIRIMPGKGVKVPKGIREWMGVSLHGVPVNPETANN